MKTSSFYLNIYKEDITENILKNCEACGNQPETKISGDGVKIFCSECGIAVTDSRLVNHAISMWNRINMSAMELAIHGVNLLIEENLTLRNVTKRGVDAANIDNSEK